MNMEEKLEKLRAQTAQYACELITGHGMHTGRKWLEDSFNDLDAAMHAPGGKISRENHIGHRQIIAQRVAIDCIRQLSSDQLQQLDSILDEIAKNPPLEISIKR